MEKETVTLAAVKADIAVFLKHRPEMTAAKYLAATLPCFAVAATLFVLAFVFPAQALLFWLGLLGFILLYGAVFLLWERRRLKNIRSEDYAVTRAVLSSKEGENYKQMRGRHFLSRRTAVRYLLHFEGGATWDIPDKLYPWSTENRTGSYFIYENAHRGAAYILVTEKKTGRVAVAYPEEFFTYKGK